MNASPGKFPFSTGFQFREDEQRGLEALFARTFLDTPYSEEARGALLRTRARVGLDAAPEAPAPGVEQKGASQPADSEGAEPTSLDRGLPSPDKELFGPLDPPRHVLLYRGESGIGKTRVFRLPRETAIQRGISVYEVCFRDVEGIPFKPFLETIRGILGDHDRGAALQEKYRYGLERLLPDLYRDDASSVGEAAPGEPAEKGDRNAEAGEGAPSEGDLRGILSSSEYVLSWTDSQKVRTFDAITQLLMEVAAEKPLLLLLHDLHWSDRPTIELLGYIGRNLSLRHREPSADAPRPAAVDPTRNVGPTARIAGESGPEVEGFDSEEWRSLTRKRSHALDLPQLWSDAASARAAARRPAAAPGEDREKGAEAVPLPTIGPRLLVLANYRGFPEPSHYVEAAIRELASGAFAYHGELRPVGREEAGHFVTTCLSGVEIDGRRLEVTPETVDAIYQVTEGFPSFTHELLRALYLREGPLGGEEGSASPWTADRIRDAVERAVTPSFLSGTAQEREPDPAAAESEAASSAPQPPAEKPGAPSSREDNRPLGARHGILRLRAASSSPAETVVLQALAIARRPTSARFLSRVLADDTPAGGLSDSDILRLLCSLEERGIVERIAADDAADTDIAFFFRVWDYVDVVEETMGEPQRARLHDRVAEAYRPRLSTEGEEVAYEVYYHFRRGSRPRRCLTYGLLAANRLLRSFALQKARKVYSALLPVLDQPDDVALRVDILERAGRIGMALRDHAPAEESLRQAQSETGADLSPERKVDLILLEAEAAACTDPNRSLKILGKATRLTIDENTRRGARLQLGIARTRLARQDVKRAINFALKGISICQKMEAEVPELGDLYRVLAAAFYRRGDYAYAVDNYQRALDVFEKTGLQAELVRTLDELGRVYLERGNYFRAARYLYKSLEVRRREHDIVGLCRSYDELGQVYLRSGDYLKTIENLNRSLAFKERIGDFAGINPTLVVLGDLYFRLGRYEQAILYFDREVANSQRLGDTRGLVEAFDQLGRVRFELGEVKQAERLSKQVNILATEFKLRSEEADGALLEGSVRAFRREWAEAEKSFKSAAEIHGKLGHRRREVCALLSLADVKFERELYDESLKYASKAQITADEVKALDLQVRALTLKGNIHRVLKGGNSEKAREFFGKALELSLNLNDVTTLFHLFYSLAKICHSDREYAEASNYYGKAELILRQIAQGLEEDRAARFLEDPRRKVFFEDLSRFRKEALGRAEGVLFDLRDEAGTVVVPREREVGYQAYKDLLVRVMRVHAALNQLHFHERLLAEAVELSGADRGFILRVQSRQYYPVAFQGFGKSPSQDPEFSIASGLLQECIRKGRTWISTRKDAEADSSERKSRQLPQLSGLVHRSILAVPFMTEDRIFGGIYLDKPTAVGRFLVRDKLLLESYAGHAAVALHNRREFETAVREPLTGYYTASYFTERLREAYRWYNLHGKSFTLLGFYLPTLENALSDGRAQLVSSLTGDLAEVLPHTAYLCWGSPILYVLLGETEPPVAEAVAKRLRERLVANLHDDVPAAVLGVHNRYRHGAEMYFEIRRRLLPDAGDTKILAELRGLLDDGISLREAKKILERYKIESTLRKTGGNITHAAKELGIHRPQLSNLLKKHALKRERFESGSEDEDLEGLDLDIEVEES